MKSDKYASLTDKQLELEFRAANQWERIEIRAELVVRFKEAYTSYVRQILRKKPLKLENSNQSSKIIPPNLKRKSSFLENPTVQLLIILFIVIILVSL